MDGLIAQLRRNQIALLSIIITCSSFAYGAWRNEVTEGNRNLRAAGFETIREVANLERVVFSRTTTRIRPWVIQDRAGLTC